VVHAEGIYVFFFVLTNEGRCGNRFDRVKELVRIESYQSVAYWLYWRLCSPSEPHNSLVVGRRSQLS
jgi:hypothetical protein